jgi:geranylgeranyl pyrophosphate synthase
MDMNEVRNVLLEDPMIANWTELKERWIQATEKPRPDWELPVIVATAVSGEALPVKNAARLMAAVGCIQISIILVDDMLDNEPHGVHETLGYGKTANMAMALQAMSAMLINKLWIESYNRTAMVCMLSVLGFDTASGQQADIQEEAWTETRYWEIVEQKSAPFYGGIMAMGVAMVISPAESDLVGAFFEIGELVGEMVQIRDDLMDIMAQPAAPDWAHGGNLMMIYGRLAEDSSAFETAVQRIVQNGDLEALESAQQILIDEGCVDYCVHLLEERREKAAKILIDTKIKNHQPVQAVLNKLVIQISDLLVEAID